MNTWPELLLINKPVGISSFDVIRRLRKEYTETYGTKAPKMGHAGTLDPAASGLMLIGVGTGTKSLSEHIKLDKEYVAEVLLGRSTTTGDVEGEVLAEAPEVVVTTEAVTAAVQQLVGTNRLPVSAYSAIKKDGVAMYKRARAAAKLGELVHDVPVRDMVVHEAEFLGLEQTTDGKCMVATVRFLVGSGTYIRSLGEELGRRLGCPASLQALQRTKVGAFSLKDARTLK